MLRLLSSLLVLLLGTTAAPARVGRPRRLVRRRGRPNADDDAAADRVLEAAERPRAQARQRRWSWTGGVEFVHERGTVTVPGRWALEPVPSAGTAAAKWHGETAPLPDPAQDPAAWAQRLRRVLALQEPGSRLAVESADAGGWQALRVLLPTRPPTRVEVDRDALARLLGGTVVVRLRIDA
jgi:hypothetical protein